MQLSYPVHWRRGQRKEYKKIRPSTVLVDVYTSKFSTAKIEQAFLLEGEKIDGTSETVGIQWLTTDYQEYLPLSRVFREVIGGGHHENIWWSESNELTLCVQGCITNLLHHMRAGEAAAQFQRLSTMRVSDVGAWHKTLSKQGF